MWQTLQYRLVSGLERFLDAVVSVIPALVVLVTSVLFGVIVGLLLRAILLFVFRIGRVGEGSSAALLRAAGIKTEPRNVAATASFWVAVCVALAVGVNALEPSGLKTVLSDMVSFLPRLLAAALIFLLGLGVASLVRRSVLLGAVNAGLPWARFGARGAHAVVLAFFVAAALDHIGVGRAILVAAFSIVAGGLVLALALAFGLGARDLARAYLEKKLRAEYEDTGIRHV